MLLDRTDWSFTRIIMSVFILIILKTFGQTKHVLTDSQPGQCSICSYILEAGVAAGRVISASTFL